MSSKARGRDPIDAIWRERMSGAAVSDAVHDTLREAIVHGHLPAGGRLAEEELARRFAVSRTPIREALLRLESEQMAERIPRRGLVVSTITPADILDLYVVRQAVDAQAARLAASNASPSEVLHLRWMNQELGTAASARDFPTMAALNFDFHEALCRAGRSPLLLYFMQQVHDRVRRFPGTTFSHGDRARESIDEHDAILDAIADRDPDRAGKLGREHMARALEVRIAMLGGPQSLAGLQRPLGPQDARSTSS